MIWNSVRLALRSIQRNLMRSALTILGVVIGVAAVITMVNAGQGATALVGEQIASMGSNLIVVGPGQSRGPGSPVVVKLFEIEDARAIRNELDSMIEAIAPSAETKLITVNGAETWSTTVLGTTSDFFDVRDWPLESGRRFYAGEESSGAPVCILGATVREKLFGQQSPLGERIRAGKFSCRVVGLMSAKGQTTMGTDQDDRIVIPIGTYWRRVAGNRDVSYMQISARDGIDTQRLTERIAGILRDRRNIRTGEDDDFHVRDMKEIANTLAGATRVLTVLLGAIAAVSLIVGGIGIMNIM
ncbi:MAG: ABC transporter permease, partial [Leptospiraceae bacterium]|nr:ABC transporter permease [Leptospiraceae bacterium]